MRYPVPIEGFEGQTIEVEAPGFLSGAKLLVNGQPAPKGPKRMQMILHRNDGKEVIATWSPVLMGLDMPRLSIDGKPLNVIAPLKWYEWMWEGGGGPQSLDHEVTKLRWSREAAPGRENLPRRAVAQRLMRTFVIVE